jgi:hypothetical protein
MDTRQKPPRIGSRDLMDADNRRALAVDGSQRPDSVVRPLLMVTRMLAFASKYRRAEFVDGERITEAECLSDLPHHAGSQLGCLACFDVADRAGCDARSLGQVALTP